MNNEIICYTKKNINAHAYTLNDIVSYISGHLPICKTFNQFNVGDIYYEIYNVKYLFIKIIKWSKIQYIGVDQLGTLYYTSSNEFFCNKKEFYIKVDMSYIQKNSSRIILDGGFLNRFPDIFNWNYLELDDYKIKRTIVL